jgi:polysaccharide export outer membrane protein
MRSLVFPFFILIIVFLSSCGPERKIPYNYLVDAKDTSGKDPVKVFEPIIQKNDLLSIQVYTSTTVANITDAQYNLPALSTSNAGQNSQLTGYLVDQNGNIDFPKLGQLHVEGLTKSQLSDLIKSRITDLTNPSVIVRYLNYRITVLGRSERTGNQNDPL